MRGFGGRRAWSDTSLLKYDRSRGKESLCRVYYSQGISTAPGNLSRHTGAAEKRGSVCASTQSQEWPAVLGIALPGCALCAQRLRALAALTRDST